jgi:hypothetical protein
MNFTGVSSLTRRFLIVLMLLVLAGLAAWAQTATTGAIVGTVTDPQGRVVPGATVKIVSTATNEVRTLTSDRDGAYMVLLLPVGEYRVEVSAPGFASFKVAGVGVHVTEKSTVNAQLHVGTVAESVEVSGRSEMVQHESAVQGAVVEPTTIVNLPLATRNFTQLLALSPGVNAGVPNATGFGLNSMELSAQGSRQTDNGIVINGVDSSNVFTNSNGSYVGTQGIAVPAADSIEEFKVQTGLYSAATGRHSGANVAVITKSGTNKLHGNIYEYFRNDALNANDFFNNKLGIPRGVLKQNQFGGTLGGPIRKDKLFFFGSYQGTRQVNGIASGAASTAFLPPLTNDRSAAALGAIFGGQKALSALVPGGLGVAVAPDGSNINPAALKLLQYKLPNGNYLIPNPGSANGLSKFVLPGHFSENQFNANLDWQISAKDRLSEKYLFSRQNSLLPFNNDGTSPNALPGSGRIVGGENQNLSLTWTRSVSPTFLNTARIGYSRMIGTSDAQPGLKASDFGITTSPGAEALPMIVINGMFSVGPTFNSQQGVATSLFAYSDSVSWVRGRHNISFGFEAVRNRSAGYDNVTKYAELLLLDFPSFLLGQAAGVNGMPFSDVEVVVNFAGEVAKDYRMLDLGSYFQDDIHLTRRLTVNVGVRHDFLGAPSDAQGRNSNFDFYNALQVPPAGGTNSGYVVGKDTPGTIPSDVVRFNNNTLRRDKNLSNFGPRIGFSWQPLQSTNLVIRGGYGIYYTNRAAIGDLQNSLSQPFSFINQSILQVGSTATLQNPLPPMPAASAFPLFVPRTATSSQTVVAQSMNMKSPYLQQWSLGFQYQFKANYLLDLSYVGTKGTHLIGYYMPNQGLIATAANPVHGVTTSTTTNVAQRVPVVGLNTNVQLFDSIFYSKYNSLQASVTKRMGHGVQFTTSYTFSKLLDNMDQGVGDMLSMGVTGGDQTKLGQSYGPAVFDRTHRLVFSYIWDLPKTHSASAFIKALVNGWATSGLLTLQSGTPFTVTDSGAATIYGVIYSRAQFANGFDRSNAAGSGSVESRLDKYFNTAAFTTAPALGNGTDFGNSGRGILRGPGQRNIDFSLIRHFPLTRLREGSDVEFRAEAFNLTNTPNFGNPGTNRAAPSSFGVISGTTINPRVMQLALKVSF